MAQIHNSELISNTIKAARIATAYENPPNQIAEKVVPVIDVNPLPSIVSNVVESVYAANAATTAIYTTPTTRDFYLCGGSCSVIKDAGSTSVATSISITVGGATKNVVRIVGISGTAQADTISFTCPQPIKVDRATAINVINTTNNANISHTGSIWGYLTEGN